MSENTLAELAGLLERLACLYEKLLELENEKTQALTKGDVNALTKVMNSEQAVLMESRNAESSRIELCRNMECKTFAELVESSKEHREALEPVYVRLTEAVTAVKKANALNMKLLETRLYTIRYMLEKIGLSEQSCEHRDPVLMKA